MKNGIHLKRTLALMVACCMTLVLLAGCTASPTASSTAAAQQTAAQSAAPSASAAATVQKPELYTIQILSDPMSVVKTSGDTKIGQVLKDKFNIEFEFLPITGDAREKQNLMLASGDYPEILRLEGDDMVKKYISAGALVQLDQYLPQAKNFTTRFAEQIPYWRVASPDGMLYKWEELTPQDFAAGPEINDMAVRTDALEKQGWPNLVTEDDWFNFLKTSLEQMPTTNGQKTIGLVMPMAESWGPSLTEFMEKGGTFVDQGTNDAVIWNETEQKWVALFTNQETIENYRWFNKLYRAGILDKDCFTDTLDQVRSKLTSGAALSMWYITWEASGANTALEAAGHPEMQYINMPVRTNAQQAEKQKRLIRVETTRPFDSVVITKNAKDPKRIFDMVDWCLSDEGQILLQSGIEGDQYTIVDGKRVPTEAAIKAMKTDVDYTEKIGLNLYRFLGSCRLKGADGINYNLFQDPAYLDQQILTDRQKAAYKALGWTNSNQFWLDNGVSAPNGLASTCSLDSSTEEGVLDQKFVEFRMKAGAKLITAKTEAEFESTLASLTEEYNKMGMDKVVDKYNEILAANKTALEKYK
jgi:putative aldouronate transport system substrate-binding protein